MESANIDSNTAVTAATTTLSSSMLSSTTTSITNITTTPDEYAAFYRIAKETTGLYLFPLICVIGIIGNLLTFIVFIKFKPRSSTNVYLTALAISDTIKLLCDFLYFIVVVLDKTGNEKASEAVFTTLYPYAHYTVNFCLTNTAWLTVSVAVERYIYMKYPERANTICTISRAKITCTVVWISAMLVTVPFALRYKRQHLDGKLDVVVTSLWEVPQFKDVYVWIQNILRSIIPLVVLIYINGWIIHTLSQASKKFVQRPVNCKNRVTVMLLAIIISFLLCITPDAIMSTVFGFGYTEGTDLIRGVREISDLLLSVNSAISFFLYFGFNKVFRHNFARVFCTNYYWEQLNLKEEGIT